MNEITIKLSPNVMSKINRLRLWFAEESVTELCEGMIDDVVDVWLEKTEEVSFKELVDESFMNEEVPTKEQLIGLAKRYLKFNFPNNTDKIDEMIVWVEVVANKLTPGACFWEMMYDHDNLEDAFVLFLNERLLSDHILNGVPKRTTETDYMLWDGKGTPYIRI